MGTMLHELNSTMRMYEDVPLLMPKWGYVLSAFVLFVIGFFGFFLNLMAMLLMLKDRQLWTPLNIILFNLLCSDFAVSLLGNPITLIASLSHGWIFGKTMCVTYGFFMALLGIASITTLTVLSFERYLIVTRPLRSRHLSKKRALLSILFIWTYALALTTPPLIGWGNYVNEAANISCSVNWQEQSRNTLTYILFLFLMGVIVPMAVIIFSYVNIIRTTKQNAQRLGRVNKAEAKVTAMVFVMIISFTIAWTPYSVFALMEQFSTERIISPGVGVIPSLVAKSSICYDPIIYVGMNSQFQQSIKRVFGIHNNVRHSERALDNSLMSSTHKVCCINDITLHRTTETTLSSVTRKTKNGNNENDGLPVEARNDNTQPYKKTDLSTIQEIKNNSNEVKSETTNETETTYSYKKSEAGINNIRLLRSGSPVLTIIDNERMMYNKYSQTSNENLITITDCKNAYGNRGFEFHSTDGLKDQMFTEREYQIRKNEIKKSFSLDLGSDTKEKRRKLSIEPKHDTFIQITDFFRN